MDAVGLGILERELAADRRVLADATGKAAQRIEDTYDGRLEACAYELARFYTVFGRTLQSNDTLVLQPDDRLPRPRHAPLQPSDLLSEDLAHA